MSEHHHDHEHAHDHVGPARRLGFIGTRWLGVGLAALVSVVTISLWATGRLALYVNPDGAWFAVAMSVITLAAAIASFALPLGAEADHGHDHGEVVTPSGVRAPAHVAAHVVSTPPSPSPPAPAVVPDIDALIAQGLSRREIRERLAASAVPVSMPATEQAPVREHAVLEHAVAESRVPAADGHGHPRRTRLGLVAAVTGGIAASAVAVAALVLPPATLSVELAMSRDLGVAPLFAGADVVQLASGGDMTTFGIGEWATVFQTAPNLDVYDGAAVELVGFVVPGDDGGMRLSRLVVTHCVIDAQPAGLPVASPAADFDTGQWVRVDGTVRAGDDGALVIEPAEITAIDEPTDPYEY